MHPLGLAALDISPAAAGETKTKKSERARQGPGLLLSRDAGEMSAQLTERARFHHRRPASYTHAAFPIARRIPTLRHSITHSFPHVGRSLRKKPGGATTPAPTVGSALRAMIGGYGQVAAV